MKFRLVFKTKTKKGNDVIIKFKVPPSKVQGLVNFLKIALEHGNDVEFTVERITKEKREESKIKGIFNLFQEEDKEQEKSSHNP